MSREYFDLEIDQRLIHLLGDLCPWGDLELLLPGQVCTETDPTTIAEADQLVILLTNPVNSRLIIFREKIENIKGYSLFDWLKVFVDQIRKY